MIHLRKNAGQKRVIIRRRRGEEERYLLRPLENRRKKGSSPEGGVGVPAQHRPDDLGEVCVVDGDEANRVLVLLGAAESAAAAAQIGDRVVEQVRNGGPDDLYSRKE